MKRIIAGALCALGAIAAGGPVLATVAPKNGGPMPPAYFKTLAKDKTAFTMRHAWIQKTQRIRAARNQYLRKTMAEQGPMALSQSLPAQYEVTGTLRVPVFAGYFSGQSAPYAISTLQNKVFDNNPTGTVTDYYHEVSYNAVTLTGTVYGWVGMPQVDTYYAGISNGLNPADARVGEFMKTLLDYYDTTVDFGQYDNDGPDGIPNSGDDDGYVDFVAFVHNETGGECGGNSHIWSHRWVYRAWNISNGLPYSTNDPCANGGTIKIDDYTIQPAINCDGSSVIDVGVFCHEFGHSFGLPDLYDVDGGGNGIGYWGIMGAGNWNTPSSPAHPCAWTRAQLGWVTPTTVDWTDAAVNLPAIESTPTAAKLPFSDDRFRRSNACVISGSWSLYCGLPSAEGVTRGWATPGTGIGGYGSNWDETVQHDFTYDGSGNPVTWSYKYRHDTETDYDYGYAIIDVGGTDSTLVTYTGTGSGTETLDLTPFLEKYAPTGGAYTLKYHVTSDPSWADDDGHYDSNCGALAIDDVSVTGGGESYTSGFETYVDGWYQDPAQNPSSEYWLVENRRRVGFDANLKGQGLLITHIDQEVMDDPYLGNSGVHGSVRGVVVQEADGLFQLNSGVNRGDAGDIYPGTTSQTSYTSVTTPNSNDNTGRPTRIAVTNIPASAATVSPNIRAGDPPPQAASVLPDTVGNDLVAVSVAVTGDLLRHGASFYFTNPVLASSASKAPANGLDIVATSLEWIDPTHLVGTVDVYAKTPGMWDLVVTNPDGQTVTVPGALRINQVVATRLVSARLTVVNGAVELAYQLFGREDGETIRLYRSTEPDAGFVMVASNLQPQGGPGADGLYTYRDSKVEPGTKYYYVLESREADGTLHELHRGSATVPAGKLQLAQNIPNPFNPTTSIRFYLPERRPVRLAVYDVSGTLVKELTSGWFGPGPHEVTWNGTDARGGRVASGVYLYRLTAGRRVLTRKMVLLK